MQPALPFKPRIDEQPPYRPSPQQLAAESGLLRQFEAFGRAVGGLTSVILTGPAEAGKTRLLEELLLSGRATEFEVLTVAEVAPLELFAEINRCASAGMALVLEARQPVSRWYQDREDEVPPDLTSRLGALPVVTVERPGVEGLLPALVADLDAHGHRLNESEAAWVAGELPRSMAAPRRFCRALDRAGGKEPRRALLQWAVEQAHLRPESPD
ncbi:hypothetical protein HK107_08455 [Parvularcula sp. ZS-1/3]|uniref:ATP-binding protein n=1 Tax=Parvularcula mediterranea TaxID=2732508 RepID=A0A7Y3RLL8_9PROT|nr:hypothetical protein [Parvularcula mediterranea]